LETWTENVESHLGGAGAVDVEKAEIGIAGKPDVSALAVNAPGKLGKLENLGSGSLF
jgi:hypothetical protein